MVFCIGPTPAAQRVMIFKRFVLDSVNRAASTLDGAAGKSVNVAKVLKVLGEHPVAFGFLGGTRGEWLGGVLRNLDIELDLIRVTSPSRECVTIIDEATGVTTELVEEGKPVEPACYEELMRRVQAREAACRAMVMSGTITRGGPVDLYRRCVDFGNARGVLTVVDAHGPPLFEALKSGPGVVKPNRPELAATVGRDLKDDHDVMAAARELHARGARSVVVTAGKAPTIAFDGTRFWKVHPPAIHALNPIGSGDSFTAALVWRTLRGDDLGEACRWAAACGAANALTPMAGEVHLEDVHRLVREARIEEVQA